MGLTAGRKSLDEVKIQIGIFQGEALSQLLHGKAIIPLNHILRKRTDGNKLDKSQVKIEYLMYIDGIKLFAKIFLNYLKPKCTQ